VIGVTAHLIIRNGRFTWSGYSAGGDPSHRPYALIVDTGRDFIITGERTLYLIGPGPMQFAEFSPGEVVLAARLRMFGFVALKDDEAASRQRDRHDLERRRLGRRRRIARDLLER
jgi:hypothetical protein